MKNNQVSVRKPRMIIILFLLFLANCDLIYMHREEKGAVTLLLLLVLLVLRGGWNILKKEEPEVCVKSFDFTAIFLVMVFIWGIIIQHLGIGDPVLYPSPMRVVSMMIDEFPRFVDNFIFSIVLLIESFIIAFVIALPLGLILGCKDRARRACQSYIKILSLISPIAYLPYAIGIMPTFRAASVFVIFNAMFWSILNWTIHGVVNFDSEYILTAHLLGIPKSKYLFKILLPGILPDILSGVNGCITGGFTVLIAAEMLGSSRGLGYFIKYFASFLNYHKVLIGIIYLGLSVCFITWLFDGARNRLLSWQMCERKRSYGILWKIRKIK